jgi:hypothetical protein
MRRHLLEMERSLEREEPGPQPLRDLFSSYREGRSDDPGT